MNHAYDAIVVGARCAGSPTAMLLARMGHRVLLVDRATFPSDTISTHVIHPVATAALSRWGLLERLESTGCPPIDRYEFDFGPLTIGGSPQADGTPPTYCPRRTVLDKMLLDAAAQAGAEVREGFSISELVFEDGIVKGVRGAERGGRPVTERASVVIGADGRHSRVAEAVLPEQYKEREPLQIGYYSYWSGLPTHGRFEIYIRLHRGFAAMPTNDGLTLVIAGRPYADFHEYRSDMEGNYMEILQLDPEFADRLAGARRVERFSGAGVPGYFRKPYGPGWALVGDAGYNKDPITAQGILDAFLDAELCAEAVHEASTGLRSYDDAMGRYQRMRDERCLPMYEMTCEIATLEPPPPPMQALLAAIHGHQDAMDDFVRMNAGTISPAQFFSSESVVRRTGGGGQ